MSRIVTVIEDGERPLVTYSGDGLDGDDASVKIAGLLQQGIESIVRGEYERQLEIQRGEVSRHDASQGGQGA